MSWETSTGRGARGGADGKTWPEREENTEEVEEVGVVSVRDRSMKGESKQATANSQRIVSVVQNKWDRDLIREATLRWSAGVEAEVGAVLGRNEHRSNGVAVLDDDS